MAGLPATAPPPPAQRRRVAHTDPPWARRLALTVALGFLGLILIVPLAVVFEAAFRDGLGAWWDAITDDETLHAIRLTLLAAAIAVPLNTVFGLATAWAVTKHDFRGKRFLISLIDVPFAVSPVISGLLFVLLFGAHGLLGPLLAEHDVRIIFAVPGIVLATAFVTFPMVAREILPVMQRLGRDQELAALTLGASGWQIFRRVTLPSIRWGLLYGVILATARAVGEFGAVSVVSGHVRGETNTVSLHVEVLYGEFQFVAAFAVSTVLILLAVLTLVARAALERRHGAH